MHKMYIVLLLLFFFTNLTRAQTPRQYPWLAHTTPARLYRISDIPLPEGYSRPQYEGHTFAQWLRGLPLKLDQDNVYLFDGTLKANQDAQYRIIDIDIGERDLQQCADVIIRLYSEYLFSRENFDRISFRFSSGHPARWTDWMNGQRPIVSGNQVRWEKQSGYDPSYRNFRQYLDVVFTYAGSFSLSGEMRPQTDIYDLQPGDVFLQGGFPGHGVIVVDVAVSTDERDKIFMIAQSYMPAQEMHMLINPQDSSLNPWYKIKSADRLYTPEWTFDWGDLKRF